MSNGAGPQIDIEIFGKTDVGLIREHNEDNFLVADVTAGVRTNDGKTKLKVPVGEKGALLLVCDGMGGAAAGEVASQMAVDSIYDQLMSAEPRERDAFARLVRRAVERANERIFIQSRDNQSERGMGTTCTVAALVDSTLVVGQIGDSRCYILREGRLAQVTKDQSLAWQLIEAGAMTPEEAKAFEHANIILQALGVQERVEVVLSQVSLRKGDVALLCSDGLHGPVSDEELLAILVAEPDLEKAASMLIQKALDRDGPDNITVVLARFDGDGLSPPAPEDLVGFVAYDPGSDPLPEGASVPDAPTVEIQSGLPPGLMSSGDDVVTKADPGEPIGGRASKRGSRSLLGFFFLALVAAAAGGIFVMQCEKDRAAHSDSPTASP
ncbi:MAG TPA: Stp1/IreP family PP2C-type Ser/Thr phosphatase [Polyangia bacterium]|nr:Stp1/IreP family PP2C-type Ser/Thr phosphatase [Polyangia bacterium]